jgi:tetratricopeptide (TPR) repeat protein
LNFQTANNIDAAIDLFNRAIALDPRYAPAYAGLGSAFWHTFEASREPGRVEQARAACAQAVALDAELSSSHVCLGTIALGTGAVEDAVQEFQLALGREPTSDEANLGWRARRREAAPAPRPGHLQARDRPAAAAGRRTRGSARSIASAPATPRRCVNTSWRAR